MKVIKVVNSLDFGGIEKVLEIFARYYQGNKGDVVFLALGEGGATERAIRELGYRVVVWDEPTSIPQVRLIAKLAAFFRKERADVVHTTGAEANFHGIIAAFIGRVPVRIAEEIGMPAHGRLGRIGFRQVYRIASRVIAVSAMVGDFLMESGEAGANKVSIVLNPVDVNAFNNVRRRREDHVFRITSVCRLDPIKNLDLLVRGFAALPVVESERRELWMVGEGPSRKGLETLAMELELGDRVVFWGYQDKPATFLERTDLFVLPSLSEGLPVSVVEAMLTGTPCAVTKVGGAAEFILHGENGWLLDPGDQAAFNQLLFDISALPASERVEIGEKGRLSVVEEFKPSLYLDRVLRIYRREDL